MYTVLIIDDDPSIQELIKYNLQKEDYNVISAFDGINGLSIAEDFLPDLILLDIMLPGKDGFEICRSLTSNNKTCSIPIIFLSAKDTEVDKVIGLELGANDYITKPFSPRELVARIKTNIRRKVCTNNTENEIRYKNLTIKPERYEVLLNGRKINLTAKEFNILLILASNPGKVFTRDMLFDKVWGFNENRETRTLDVYIRYLRKKIEKDPSNPEYIITLRGVGYRFNAETY